MRSTRQRFALRVISQTLGVLPEAVSPLTRITIVYTMVSRLEAHHEVRQRSGPAWQVG